MLKSEKEVIFKYCLAQSAGHFCSEPHVNIWTQVYCAKQVLFFFLKEVRTGNVGCAPCISLLRDPLFFTKAA